MLLQETHVALPKLTIMLESAGQPMVVLHVLMVFAVLQPPPPPLPQPPGQLLPLAVQRELHALLLVPLSLALLAAVAVVTLWEAETACRYLPRYLLYFYA